MGSKKFNFLKKLAIKRKIKESYWGKVYGFKKRWERFIYIYRVGKDDSRQETNNK